jgi:FkbH-like protein
MIASAKTCLLIADFTLEPLPQLLRREGESILSDVTVAPFDQVNRLLLDPTHEAWQTNPEVVLVWTRPEAAIAAFARLCRGEQVTESEITGQVAEFVSQVAALAGRVGIVLVPTWSLPPARRGLGLLELRLPHGRAANLLRMNFQLVEKLALYNNVYVLDAQRWLAQATPSEQDGKLWYLAKMAFNAEVMKTAAREMAAALEAHSGRTRKLLILDLDDTLWGGVVGEIGWQNLELGGHSPLGESFQAFQMALKALTRRGVVLAIVSKNSEAVALEAIDSHPEMRLQRDDFAAWRINWHDKAANIAELVQELNLGLEAAVFIDDSPAERARVREALPDVFVPEWPVDKMKYCAELDALTCFDASAYTVEDGKRAEMYVVERKRRKSQRNFSDLSEWLHSLNIEIRAEPLASDNLKRATQLLNKTNQFNLSTRRLNEGAFQKWAEQPENQVFVFTVCDRFSTYGLTGIASLRLLDGEAYIVDLVLSCRVFSRGAEHAMLAVAVRWARKQGAQRLTVRYVPSARNGLTQEFLTNESKWHSAGAQTKGEEEFIWDLSQQYDAPTYVSVFADDVFAPHEPVRIYDSGNPRQESGETR